MSDHLLFVLGFCFLLAHEMDAVRLKEWRMLPVLSGMDGEVGYRAFVLLHVPLYALLLWGILGGGDAGFVLIIVLDAFFVVHLALHVFLRNLPENRFGSVFSWALILGAGAFGALDLMPIL